jgi:hypothetical protein
VDFQSAEAVDDLRIWTTIDYRLRVKIGAGAYSYVGTTRATSASLGAFTAGQVKQATLEVNVPIGAQTRHEELELNLGYGGDDIDVSPAFLMYDSFTTPDAAPLDDPRTCEPGPGQLKPGPNNVALRESIADGKLVYAVATDTSYSTSVWYSDAVGVDPRSSDDVGKAAFFEWADLSSNNLKYFGWSQYQAGAAGARIGGFHQVNANVAIYPEGTNLEANLWTGTNKFISIVRGECYFFYVVDGLLRWVGTMQLETTGTAYIQASPRLNPSPPRATRSGGRTSRR